MVQVCLLDFVDRGAMWTVWECVGWLEGSSVGENEEEMEE